jgi:gliding motility-associated-like protein
MFSLRNVTVSNSTIRSFAFVICMLALPAIHGLAQENIPPEITGQTTISTEEDTPVEILFSDLIVTDPDDTYPEGFTLNVQSGVNYTVSGTEVTPDADFSGTLNVPVTVNDGETESAPFTLLITVNAAQPENEKPVITGQVPLQTDEGQPLTISLNDLVVEDADDPYPTGFTLNILPGANYTISGQTIAPDAGFSGTLNVPVTVNDGEEDSDPFTVAITVNEDIPENVPPTIADQVELNTDEGTPITIQFSHLAVNDPDDNYPTGFTMSLSPGSNYTVSGRTITPDEDFIGMLTVPVTVNDGEASSAVFNLLISVNATDPENIAPVITGQSPLTTDEGKKIKINLDDLVVTDPDNSYPRDFTMILGDGPNYSVDGHDIIPDEGFSGTLSVPVTVNDGEASSDPFTLSITVEPEEIPNVKPDIVDQIPLSILSSETLTITFNHLIVTDPDNSYPNGFTLKVSGGPNYTVTNGTTIRPSTNFQGLLAVKVTVNDGQAESDPFDLMISVSAPVANVAPVITGQQELTTFKNTAVTLRLTHLIVVDPDDPYPGDFKLIILPGQNYTVSGSAIKPANGFTGTLTATVRVNDGTDPSQPFNLIITVVEKDELRVIGQDELIIGEDSTLAVTLDLLHVNDPSGKYPAGFSVVVDAGANYTVNGSSVTPGLNFSGTLEIPVSVKNATSTSNVFKMIILVTPENDAPLFITFSKEPINFGGDGAIVLAPEAVAADPDNEVLAYAEVFIDQADFSSGKDFLGVISEGNVRSVFDPNTGILVLLGQSTIADYQDLIRRVQYQYISDTLPSVRTRRIHFRLNDGQDFSEIYTKVISLGETIVLDIPNVFSPNDDNANDSWVISRQSQSDRTSVTVRVYDKRGGLVFESYSLDDPWDGRYNGENLPTDTYFYTIEIRSQANSTMKKGVVTILR